MVNFITVFLLDQSLHVTLFSIVLRPRSLTQTLVRYVECYEIYFVITSRYMMLLYQKILNDVTFISL